MIFLSASVPTPKREYFDTENIFAIREAIVSFTKVCAEYSLPFYFGGHPAITPLIWKVAMHNTKKAIPLIKIYQSKIFGESIPKEVDDFKHVFFTESVNNSIKDSVNFMREQMFRENKTECAVFIGGMKGVIDEYNLLKGLYPNAKYYAFASTGGASYDLYKMIGSPNSLLEGSYAYMSIFRKILSPFIQQQKEK